MAAGWSHRREFMWDVSREVGEWMVSALEPQPGQTVLELAAGVGDTGFAAAAALGDDGKLISTDFSAEMVDAARRRAAELGLLNVECRVMDAERMDLPDDSVDGVLCRWGYMLMADPGAALLQTRRVLRDEGRLALSVWGEAEANPWASIPGKALVDLGYAPAPEPGTPGIFALADSERLRELLAEAGFDNFILEHVPVRWSFDDFAAYWAFTTEVSGALALVIQALPDADRERARTEVEARFEPLRGEAGYELPGLCVVVLAS